MLTAGRKRILPLRQGFLGKTYVTFLKDLKKEGYTINAYYLWLQNIDLALKRIKGRVREGGHNVPEDVVCRRYSRSLHNLFHVYRPLFDSLMFLDNSLAYPAIIAIEKNHQLKVTNQRLFNALITYSQEAS